MKLCVKRLCQDLLLLSLLATLVLSAAATGNAWASDPTWTQTSQEDFESGMLFQVDTVSSPGDVKLAEDGAGANYVYALRGNNRDDFWRYDIGADGWTGLADTPGKVKWGGALAHDGGSYIYALRGNDRDDFWRYDIAADGWDSLEDTPGTVKEGGALTYDGGSYIYALRGNNTRSFWRYDIGADSWTALADTQDYVKEGGALTYDGSNYVYAFQCDYNETLWRYDITADNWSLMADSPSSAGYGAALAYDGSSYIYALRGEHSDDFWRYNSAADNWTFLESTPGSVEWGGALAYDGGSYIYALRGKYTDDFWRYDIATDDWDFMEDTPGTVKYGGALAMSGNATYQISGTLTSSVHDTGYSADFGNISWTATTQASTVIKFQIATNSDNSTWNFIGPGGTSGSYYTSSGTGIWTGHDGDRYIKYKSFLSTTDGSVTPTLHDVSITYNQQSVLPTVTTANATLVEETTATLHGTVSSDGGEACQYRFEYGTASGGPYTSNTTWTGSVTTRQPFSANITILSEGTRYYFRAQVKNSAGTGSGAELALLTKPDPPVSFTTGNITTTQIDLSWTKGAGALRTMVRRKTGDYPADRSDGYQVYFGSGTSVSDTGLSPGTTYYYKAWSEVSGSQQWSDGFTAVAATTDGGAPIPPPTAVGGIVYPVNKARVLAPWLALFSASALAITLVVLLRRKSVYQH